MLIIFDLDDTLIDTTGSIVPYKMKLCLEHLQRLGVRFSSFEESYCELMALNASSLRSLDAIKKFLLRYDVEASWLEALPPILISPLPEHFSIATTPNAKEILEEFSLSHSLALVTGGHPPFQREKLEKAGIEPALFSNILIPEDCVKLPSYRELSNKFFPMETLVCGDRVSMDLAPAREMGFTTVHMRWGRGLINQTEPWVDYAISDLRELREIVR